MTRRATKPSARLRLDAVILASVMLPILVWAWVAIVTHGRALEVAAADERRVTDAVRQHTLRLLDEQALALDLMDHEAGDGDCSQLRSNMELRDLMALVVKRTPSTDGIWIIGADGLTCVADSEARTDQRNRSVREYFNAAKAAGPDQYYVDRAVLGLADGLPVFNIAKARFRNGVFDGVILVAVKLSDLRQYWQEVMGATSTQRIALFRNDGATIARSWDPLVPPPDPASERRVAATWHVAPEGEAVGTSLIDGTRRVGAWRMLQGWGIVVSNSVSEAEVLRPWRQSMETDLLVALLASLVLGGSAWLLLRSREELTRKVEQRTVALRASEERLSLFIERAPAAIAMLDADMRYLAVSKRYLDDYRTAMTGAEAIVGRSFYEVFPQAPVQWREVHRRVLSGETLSAEEDPYQRPDGRLDWVRWEMAPWRRNDGEPGGVVLFSELVTARREAEAVLSRSRAELEQLVADRTRDLEVTQAHLAHAQRMEALGQLAGGIAHDFNNVMQSVLSAAALIERRASEPERVRGLSRLIVDAAGRGAAITRRLLAFGRQSDLQSEPIDPQALLLGIQEILAHTIGSGIVVRVEVPAGLPGLFADKGQLETVLVNLATNARDAMPDGGCLVLSARVESVGQDGGPGALITLEAGRYVCLAVSDVGSGMAPEVLARASEPFFTTKPIGKGTGLGLAMARGFTEQSGGGLQIESQIGQGTTITVWLPARSGDASEEDLVRSDAYRTSSR